MVVIIIGASGGIGSAIAKEVLARYPSAEVHGTYFKTQTNVEGINWHQVDVSDESAIESLSTQFQQVDWLVNCVGFLHSPTQGPEKNLNAVSSEFYLANIRQNALPTLLLAKYFTPSLKRCHAPKFATISAKVGSITDNQLGGWYSYRSSKAALNMLIKTISIEWGRTLPKATILALHPGTTDTPLSKPFQANVPANKLFLPSRVAHDLVNIIEQKQPHESGRFYSYSGEELPW